MSEEFLHPLPLVRFGEFDIGGVLYHAHYFHLYESARESLLLQNGLPYHSLVARGCHIALVETHQNFLRPLLYGTPYQLWLWTADIRRTNLMFHYRIETVDGALLHTAWTKAALVAQNNGSLSAAPFPEDLRHIFQRYERQAPPS